MVMESQISFIGGPTLAVKSGRSDHPPAGEVELVEVELVEVLPPQLQIQGKKRNAGSNKTQRRRKQR